MSFLKGFITLTALGLGMNLVSGVAYAEELCSDRTKCSCVDLSQGVSKIPSGWHIRYKQKPNETANFMLNRVTVVKNASNPIRCRYQNSDGLTITLSGDVPSGHKFKPMGSTWAFDEVDQTWECAGAAQKDTISVSQCMFSF